MDINVVAENLSELLTNSVNMTQVYYDLFFNPNPMDITLYQYDEDNKLVEVVIPNRAKDKIRLEEIAAEIASKIDKSEKGEPDGVATLDSNGKVPLKQMNVINDTSVEVDQTYSSKIIEEKLQVRPIDPEVVHKAGAETITGSKTFLDNTNIGNTETNADLNIVGDLNIQGNIVQNGSSYETHAEQVFSKDDYVVLRDGAVTGLTAGTYAGLEINLYDGVNKGRLVIDSNGVARVGDVGDEQPLLTRSESDTLTDQQPLIWDKQTQRAITSDEYYTKTQVDSAVVHKTGNETISGTKTFSAKIVGTIDKAVSDSTGRNIVDTYAAKTELNLKANDSDVVHLIGDETIEGAKTFVEDITTNKNGIVIIQDLTPETVTDPETGDETEVEKDPYPVGIKKNNDYFVQLDETGKLILSAEKEGSTITLKPNGDNSTVGQVTVDSTGNVTATKFTGDLEGTATKATQDGSGNVITTTYATKTELNSKANDSAVVHKTGNETIAGVKTFSSTISGSINGNAATATSAVHDGAGNDIASTYATTTTTGNIADLETTAKDSLVDAINELHNTTPSIESVVHIGGAETITGAKTFTSIINGSISGNAATATKATQDGSGNTITSTYIKSLSISGTTITVKKGDDTSSTITTQDNKVQSVVSAGNAKYPIHLNNGTTATTNTVLIDTGIYANPSTNTVGADTLSLASKVNMTYNSTLSSVDFEFV